MAVRVIEVRERVMAENDRIALQVRRRLEDADVASLNLMSSPGAGKTLLLERTLARFGDTFRIATVVGDVRTQNDADRLARHTTRLVQAVITGGACHLDARQVSEALDAIDLDDTDLVFIENVGNLVCPAGWCLGESANVVLFSITEGEDKPLKYPKMFERSQYAVLTKIDLLPHLDFDVKRAIGFLRDINPNIEILLTSAKTGEGMESWYTLVRAFARRPQLAGSVG